MPTHFRKAPYALRSQLCPSHLSLALPPRRHSASRHTLSFICVAQQADYVTPPAGNEADLELWEVLDLATEAELVALHNILYGRSPLSPILKSLMADNEPAVPLRGRAALMHRIEARFRFLAATAGALLKGRRPSYRESLLQVRDRLSIKCPSGLTTPELEAEIYMHLLQHHSPSVEGLVEEIESAADEADSKPVQSAMQVLKQPVLWGARGRKWVNTVAAPMLVAGAEWLPSLAKLGGVAAFGRARPAVLRSLAAKLAVQVHRCDAALRVLYRQGALGARGALQSRMQLQAAQEGVGVAAARYGTARGALAMLGPLMWAWLAADLTLLALGTDYGRLVRAIVALAQVRLLRTHGFVSP